MTFRAVIMKIARQEEINFLLTNRIPRRLATRFIGWFSRIEQPLVRDLSLFVWRCFADVDLRDAASSRFRSMHDCFTRSLRDGTRPIAMEPDILVSPCDAIVGATGSVANGQALQFKGSAYPLEELLGDAAYAARFHDGCFVTLRLTSGMYHHFHAPHDLRVTEVAHFPGDTWNVNPAALRRVPRLFCRNERAVIRATLAASGQEIALVPVAAILVAGIRLRFLDIVARETVRTRRDLACDASLRKGEEMGWFEHGSTIIVLAPAGFRPHEAMRTGETIRVGQPLLRLPA